MLNTATIKKIHVNANQEAAAGRSWRSGNLLLKIKQYIHRICYRSLLLARFLPVDQNDRLSIRVFRSCLTSTSNCIDIGAHAGYLLREMIRVATRGTHMAFEPVPRLHQLLVQQLAHTATTIHPIALSNQTGITPFYYYPDRPAVSGFTKRDEQFQLASQYIFVQQQPLDQLVPAHKKIDLIKLDAEGAELQVLQGATELLQRDKPLVLFECTISQEDIICQKAEQLFELLTACGLQISLLPDFLKGKPALSKTEFCRQLYTGLAYFFIAHEKAVDFYKKKSNFQYQ